MKILRVVGGFGGGLKNSLDLLDSYMLDNLGINKVGVIYISNNIHSNQDLTLNGRRELFPLEVSDSQNILLRYFNPKQLVKQYKKITEALSEDYDLVHLHNSFLPTSAMISLMSHIRNKPVVLSYHGSKRNSNIVWAGMKAISGVSELFSSANLAISEAAQDLFWTKSSIVDVPVNPNFFQERTSRNGNNNLVCVARLCPNKGQLDLIKALSLIKSNFTCKFVGNHQDESYTNLIRNEIESLGLEDKIELVGEVDSNEMKEIYSNSSINILPTYEEGLGKVIVEAGLAGIPTIAYEVGGVPEIVKHLSNGLLCDKGDINGLEKNIRLLLENQKLQLDLGLKSQNWFYFDFSPEKCAENYHKTYRQVLNKN